MEVKQNIQEVEDSTDKSENSTEDNKTASNETFDNTEDKTASTIDSDNTVTTEIVPELDSTTYSPTTKIDENSLNEASPTIESNFDVAANVTEAEIETTILPVSLTTTKSIIDDENDKILEKSPSHVESLGEEDYVDNSVQNYDSEEEYEDDEGKEVVDSNEIVATNIKENTTNNYVIVTMTPAKSVKDDNFKEFTDSIDMDSTDAAILNTNANEESQIEEKVADMGTKEKDDKVVSVVSVVTTKSVVNNTVIGK